jgi:hypothetical protein
MKQSRGTYVSIGTTASYFAGNVYHAMVNKSDVHYEDYVNDFI